VGERSPADYVVIKNLHLRNANNKNWHLADDKSQKKYTANAAGVFLFHGRHVTIAKCIIQSCGDGILSNHSPEVTHLKISHCLIFNNGNFANPDSSQEHNVYLQGIRTIVEFCYFGPVHSDGSLIKDRGKSTVIRYNWLSGGTSRQLDLVDYKDHKKAHAFVYGNVIIQGKNIKNYNMIHFGGDSGYSRAGTLYMFNNTMISKSSRARFFDNKSDCTIFLVNNAFVGGGLLWNGKGRLQGYNNWLNKGIRGNFDWSIGIQGKDPGFMSMLAIPYIPSLFSPLNDRGSNRIPFPVEYMPKPNGGGIRRPKSMHMDIGAFESADQWFKPGR
jgi:hypothetical protein